MKVTRNRVADLERIDPMWTEAYLRARGWTQEHAFRDIESYWSFSDDRQELVVPLKAELGDYTLRMSELVDRLAEAEERSHWEVVKDLLTANMDVVSLRVRNEDAADGSISLNGGVDLFDNARALLLSAARATIEPRALFIGGPPREVSRYLKKVRMGQTERGSYVVNLLSPIAGTPARRQGDEPSMFDVREYEAETRFSRSVIAMLNKALRSTQEAAERSKDDPTYRAFVNAVHSGVSANLCEALVKIQESGEEQGLHVDLRWAYTLPEPGRQRETFEFESSSVPVIRDGAAVLRETDPYENYLLIGRVVTLHRDQVVDLGQVTIKGNVDDVTRHVLVDLGGDDYSEAVIAHDSGAWVRVQGRLRNKGPRWFLEAPRGFSILENRPLS